MNSSVKQIFKSGVVTALLLLIATNGLAFQPGEKAPGFSLLDLTGEKVSLSDYSGQVVVLELGTTWCPGCRFQSKEIGKLGKTFPAEEVAVYEIFMQEKADTVRRYLDDLNLATDHALLDDGQVQKAYNVYLIPRVLVIDSGGEVVFDRGMVEAAELEEIIRPLLDAAEKGVAQ